MARNRVIYQSEGLIVSSGAAATAAVDHEQLERVQSANYSYTINRQDVNQYGNITHLDSNNSFIKFHTIGNNIGTQDAISITSNANTLYCLYKRTGTFINNGTDHPTGYYVVKEDH